MHLLSESARWSTASEFVDSNGKISKATGETNIIIQGNKIQNKSWASINNEKLENIYEVSIVNDFLYNFKSYNPACGTQKGVFSIDRNVIYSKFIFENSKLDGFEVIVRNQDECVAYGSLYNDSVLVNTWTAIMRKHS